MVVFFAENKPSIHYVLCNIPPYLASFWLSPCHSVFYRSPVAPAFMRAQCGWTWLYWGHSSIDGWSVSGPRLGPEVQIWGVGLRGQRVDFQTRKIKRGDGPCGRDGLWDQGGQGRWSAQRSWPQAQAGSSEWREPTSGRSHHCRACLQHWGGYGWAPGGRSRGTLRPLQVISILPRGRPGLGACPVARMERCSLVSMRFHCQGGVP